MPIRKIDGPGRRGRGFLILVGLFLALASGKTLASYSIEYEWWKEVGQLDNFFNLLLYSVAPVAAVTVIIFLIFWIAHARALKHAGTGLAAHPLYSRLSTLGILLVAFLLAGSLIDSDTVIRFFGGQGLNLSGDYRDPAFHLSLSFYFFQLPFYSLLLTLTLTVTVLTALLYWAANRLWSLRHTLGSEPVDLGDLQLHRAFESMVVRLLGSVALAALAIRFFLDRYELVFRDHGFMVGIDYVDDHFTLPLRWLSVAVCLFASALMAAGRWRVALLLLPLLLLPVVIPPIANGIYVRPNEISLQRSYIRQHIEATRAAYGLDRRIIEKEFAARLDSPVDVNANRRMLDNIRLWDWRAFHETVTQIQSLRTYYEFADTDVDRYMIGGMLRQMLLTPRELDVQQLPDARTRWINPHFIYTHGYGLVMAEANRITSDGLPVMLIQDAPPKISEPSLKLTRPEIYFGESEHEPVFVHTAQPEFNYPAGADNVHTTYQGKGGFPISSLLMRLAAAVHEGDANILLTGYLTGDSRMMIRRKVKDRVETLAPFLRWDHDPYIILTAAGRLMWMIDGYATSESHPYSRSLDPAGLGSLNYLRNSVKATVDAYDGSVHMYIFDPADPIIQAHSRLFPGLFEPSAAMPAELRAHARYPEQLFQTQAEVYRAYHMREPDSFYNREDLWDVAATLGGQERRPERLEPTYVLATLPGETEPEFLLMLPFTPRNKQNLVGVMAARCDGPHLGELVVLQLSKQALVFGPMQVDARIDQDSTISKDLSLWNQQGSQVVRGRMLVLPVDDTFLYVEPIYIRSSQTSMPQLKKIAIAVGNSLIYTDTYPEALARLQSIEPGTGGIKPNAGAKIVASEGTPSAPPDADRRIEAVRDHLRRYRDLSGQGKWTEAGKELEALENAVRAPAVSRESQR